MTKAANGRDIELTDTAAIAATGNEIGGTISGSATPCDGPCNLISGATTAGINLQGDGGNEKPATGPTTIHGNFLGLNAAGTTAIANTKYGIFTSKAGEVTIGGPTNGDANYIAGGEAGIYYVNGEGFKVLNNFIGSGPVATDATSPTATGIFLSSLENSTPAVIYGNVIKMEGGVGIEARFGGTEISFNSILEAELGILTKVAPGPAGANLIENNEIEESIANGIRIEDDSNLVFGNSIFKSGAAGIRLQAPAALLHATKNKIGGNTAARENDIRESGGDAIEIDNTGEEETSQNEIARNKGEKNAGLFIDLIGATTNGGIQPPAFATSLQTSATGTGAGPGATIRVFRKASAEAGELQSFLGEAVADSSGNWKVTYPAVPVGIIVAATQTNVLGGTSELATATSVADPSGGGGGGGNNGGGCNDALPASMCAPPSADTTAPKVTISKGPKAKSASTTAKFKFKSNEGGSKFQCKFDKGKFKNCKSPKTYKKLKPGKHVFKVRAIDRAGNVSKPAKRKFTVTG